MMTMEECLQPKNTGWLVYHLERNFIAILTNEKWVGLSTLPFITIIRRDGTSYGAAPEYLTVLKPGTRFSLMDR